MINHFLEIVQRAQQGPEMSKADWDFEVIVQNTRRLVQKYRLVWDKTSLVPQDAGLVERIFQAGFELACLAGVYDISTGRVIQFSQAELQEGLERMPRLLWMGEGPDARLLTTRQVQDSRPPLIWAGNPGVPTPEQLFLPMVMSWMQEPLVDLATCGSLTTVDGFPVATGQPGEVLATRRELALLREGLRRVGRPGMGLLAAQSSVSELGDLAVANPDYLRPVDAHLVALFNELVIDSNNLTRAANSLDYGMRNASLACVMAGGLAGDAPGAAVVQVASFILANLVCRAHYHLLHPIHIRHVATSTRPVLWMQSAVEQAFARHAPAIIVADIYPKSGALTRELLYEVAACALVNTVSGGHLEGVGSADGALPNGTGLEVRWMAEVGHAAARQGLDLEQANALALRLLEKYAPVFERPGGNPGVRFDQAYDVAALQPLPEWQAMYESVKAELRGMGLNRL